MYKIIPLLTFLVTLPALSSEVSQQDDKLQRVCHKVNGKGVSTLRLTFDKDKKTIAVTIPQSFVGPETEFFATFNFDDLYEAKLFHDDYAVTYSVSIGTDVDGDYVVYKTSGDIDPQTSFYRCEKSGILLQ